ncbi:MAG: hypothetical protein JJLCMIEE_02796 [Acidimicrobiales bacterium]|nr:hypothetical protein [Acidimicrobiales bacterium]
MMASHTRTDFGIALKALPIVVAVVLAKFGMDQLGWDSVELNALYSGLVAANVFLVGFLLAGTLADYKESEKLPGELAGRVKTIADECQILYRAKQAPAARACLEHLAALASDIDNWLHGRVGVEIPLDRLDGLNGYFLEFEQLTQPNFIVRLKQEQSALRLLVIRINTIKETSFVGAGYLVAEATSLLLIVALLMAEVAQLPAELFLIGAIAFLLTYMILLIRDMDDPFDFDHDGQRGAAEVSLAPLEYLEETLARDLASLDGHG